MGTLLPGFAVVEAFGDSPEERLFPAEEAFVATAAAERRREFSTVRSCARRAMAELGLVAAPIVNDADGVPSWPSGVIGSMTHCLGYRAAAIASAATASGVGIDAEPNLGLTDGVRSAVFSDNEQADLAAAALAGVSGDRLVWCIKESAYKAWFPIARCWVSPKSLRVAVRQDSHAAGLAGGSFTVHVIPEPGTARDPLLIQGRWLADSRLVLAAATI